MAVLPIRKYPDPVLRQPAQPVSVIDEKLRRLAADMVETMEDANGVGLAAPQVGESVRMVVVDFDPENGDPRVLINPVITKRSGRKELGEEGCLSFPGLRTRVKRSPKVVCEAQNLDGEIVEYQAEGLSARAVQHELDHLDGFLFVDKAGPSDKLSLKSELEELEDNWAELHG
ncbi:MAG: peptide deformylase [Planctomycetaceae bacterium]|nr:peptide deformylase [Planctomycetaceae bacterium]